MRRSAQAFLLAILLPGAGIAQDLEAGRRAAEIGDYATALREWAPLAEQGDPRAQHNVGLLYDKGKGVPQDYAEAAKWYRLAAGQGHPPAQNNLGLLYKEGHGVPQDYAEAANWFRLAAEQGNASAQANLGVLYENGNRVLQDYIAAHMWYNIAASAGRDSVAPRRDAIAAKMQPSDVSEAQRRARVCLESKFSDRE